ncbi:MAG: bifunctional 3,4-dihydroxy-2-butanone-4-phosphate synthase/GTP cyclohydrolase II [Candidatus Omnitrophota bacterium]|jgi:3,4-dihydroxy 2-butanone 4-phosphate synthase/GTP cyclohydrolase II|nr:MAG: bifunctional 3,4-dihydroxy-2-butanone-4-phosphate synthase/GTP cyclohydrolase II [Candidatus Omnitrophota bacterium]
MTLSIEEAVAELKAGKMLIVVDDQNRENEGDLIAPAQSMTPERVNFIVKQARGLLCVAIDKKRAEQLNLHLMTADNTALHSTNFAVTVDAVKGTTTGISATDRAITIRTLADPNARPEDLGRPGHISPIIAKAGGVLRRAGHTEAVVDLMNMAGFEPAGVLCEILDDDGNMARMPSLERLSSEYDIGIVTIEDLIAYRNRTETLVEKVLKTNLPTKFGNFVIHLYVSKIDEKKYLALVKGDVTTPDPVLVRVHSQCITGDLLGSLRCDCGPQLHYALKKIEEEGRGILLYMPQEGRGIGLISKLKAYVLQDEGYDTVEANLKLGKKADERDYGIGEQILVDLGVHKMRLMTNNPKKITGLSGYGLEIVEQIPIRVGECEFNVYYLETKKQKMGHQL